MLRFKSHGLALLTSLLAFPITLPATGAMDPPAPIVAPCADRAAVVELLGKQYGEQRRGLGLTFGGQILEIFVARDGHWSALLSYADGKSCMIGGGEGWMDEKLAGGEQS